MEAVNKVAQFPSDLEVENTIGMCGGQMTSRGEQKLTSEMMKRAQQCRRTMGHESQQPVEMQRNENCENVGAQVMRIVKGSQNHTAG